MNLKVITGDCIACESTFHIHYSEKLVSSEEPHHCPFCGEIIEDIVEEYIEDDESYEDDTEWED